eukprot:COSAG01_NODE_10697_length_2102_cov_2.668997_2_plen_50_part_00
MIESNPAIQEAQSASLQQGPQLSSQDMAERVSRCISQQADKTNKATVPA